VKIKFTTPTIYDTEESAFGCASFGFAGAPDPTQAGTREWKGSELQGKLFYGKLDDVIDEIPVVKRPWQAGIVLFGNCGGENEFIRKLHAKTGCPLTGGAAACDLVNNRSGLVFGKGQVAVYLISDPDHNVKVESKNIHNNILGTHRIGFTDPRVLDTIDGEDAIEWYTKKRAEYGFVPDDFEHMTFSDLDDVNAHMSMSDGKLISGRDLCHEMVLRYVAKGDVYPQMNAFYDDKNAMIFGCAGLKGILEQDIMTDTMGMFMFGEVATIDGRPEFGNLMLSKLIIN